MPMGIVSDSDFNTELKRNGIEKPESKRADIIDMPSKGRGEGNVEVPDSLRRIIGETAISNGRQEALDMAAHFGISPSSVSAYTQGATSTSTYDKRPNADVINKSRGHITKLAISKMKRALHKITDDKLEGTNAKDLSGIAKDMSAVVKNLEEKSNNVGDNTGTKGPTFVFYSPTFRKEEHFEVVSAKE